VASVRQKATTRSIPDAAARMHATCVSACPRQVAGRDAAGRACPQPPEHVRLDDGDELRRVGAEEQHRELGPRAEAGVHLGARVAELEIGGGHHGEGAARESEAVARPVLDAAGGEAPEAALDHLDRVGRRQETADVGLGEVERHEPILAAA
jgi:hypothetical protein